MANKQRQGKCIFCDGFRLTKQHVVPNWMSPFLGKVKTVKQSKSAMYLGLSFHSDEVVVAPEVPAFKAYETLFGQLQYRVVCQACNGGWISSVEQSSKDILSPMLRGEGFDIPFGKNKLISVALALIAIMHEFSDEPARRIITRKQLNYIMRSKCLPSGWYVAVGVMEEGASERARSKFARLENLCAFSISTFALGRLLVQVVICDNFLYPVSFRKTIFRQIWPSTIIESDWAERTRQVSTEEFESVADFLNEPMTASLSRQVSRPT